MNDIKITVAGYRGHGKTTIALLIGKKLEEIFGVGNVSVKDDEHDDTVINYGSVESLRSRGINIRIDTLNLMGPIFITPIPQPQFLKYVELEEVE